MARTIFTQSLVCVPTCVEHDRAYKHRGKKINTNANIAAATANSSKNPINHTCCLCMFYGLVSLAKLRICYNQSENGFQFHVKMPPRTPRKKNI